MNTTMDDRGIWGWLREHWEAWAGASAIVLLYAARTRTAIDGARKAWAWCVMFFGAAKRVLETLDAQNKQLERIEAELRPNGGSSLRDLVESMRRSLYVASARSRFLVANSRHAVYECAADGRCTWVSPALAAMFGMSEADMIGHGWLKAIKESDVGRVQETWTRAMRDRIPYECDYTVIHRDARREYNCHTSATAIVDAAGNVVAYIGTVEYR